MKTIPRCPHCGKRVKEIKEVQTWTHTIGRIKEPDSNSKGEWIYIYENEGKTFTCARCGGNLNDNYGVMGFYDWFEPKEPKNEH